jgi:hypothetical protein
VARTVEEDAKLLEVGFEYVCTTPENLGCSERGIEERQKYTVKEAKNGVIRAI